MLNKRCITPYKRYIVVLSFASQVEFWTIQSKDFARSGTIVEWPLWVGVYIALAGNTNWAVYCCSTKGSISGHVDVSQELSIFHTLVVQFHAVFSILNFASLFPKLMIPRPFLWRGTINQYLYINSRSLETQRKFLAVTEACL